MGMTWADRGIYIAPMKEERSVGKMKRLLEVTQGLLAVCASDHRPPDMMSHQKGRLN